MASLGRHRFHDYAEGALCLVFLVWALLAGWRTLQAVGGDNGLPALLLDFGGSSRESGSGLVHRRGPKSEDEVDAAAFGGILAILGPSCGLLFVQFCLLSRGMLPVFVPWRAREGGLHPFSRWVSIPPSVPRARRLHAPSSSGDLSGLAAYRARMGGGLRSICILALAIWPPYVIAKAGAAVLCQHLVGR